MGAIAVDDTAGWYSCHAVCSVVSTGFAAVGEFRVRTRSSGSCGVISDTEDIQCHSLAIAIAGHSLIKVAIVFRKTFRVYFGQTAVAPRTELKCGAFAVANVFRAAGQK